MEKVTFGGHFLPGIESVYLDYAVVIRIIGIFILPLFGESEPIITYHFCYYVIDKNSCGETGRVRSRRPDNWCLLRNAPH